MTRRESTRAVAVVGLGLMGGSLARELASRGDRVIGYDRDPEAIAAGLREGVIERGVESALEGIEEAELLVLAVPVSEAAGVLEAAIPVLRRDCPIIDVGSTKRAIEELAERLGIAERFVGCHPLTGDHQAGWSASRLGIFADVPIYLCPTPETHPTVRLRVREFWTALGARPVELTAEEHDRMLAWTSHLPQIASTALANSLAEAGFLVQDLGPGGRDMTRLAGSSYEMWTAICQENADFIEPAIGELERRLARFREALRSGDAAAIRRSFVRGFEWSVSDDAGG